MIETTNFYDGVEAPYVESIKNVLSTGYISENRTGVPTIVQHHQFFHIKNITKNFPIILGKKVFYEKALTEMLWFLFGRNDIKFLLDRNVNYWNEWVNSDGTIGKSYGYQFRNFNGYDQVVELIRLLQQDINSRRKIISLWNASDLNEMTLAPCMYDFNFSTKKIENNNYQLDLHVRQRSSDAFLGVPYDFMLCGWLNYLICLINNFISRQTNNNMLIPNDIFYTNDNYHIYKNHLDAVNNYLDNIQENKELTLMQDKFVDFDSLTQIINTKITTNEMYVFEFNNFFNQLKNTEKLDFQSKTIKQREIYSNIINLYLEIIDYLLINNQEIFNPIQNKNIFRYGIIKAPVAI